MALIMMALDARGHELKVTIQNVSMFTVENDSIKRPYKGLHTR